MQHPFFDSRLPVRPITELKVLNTKMPESNIKSSRLDLNFFSTQNLKPLIQNIKHGKIEITKLGDVIVDFNEDSHILQLNPDGSKCTLINKRNPNGSREIFNSPLFPTEFHKRIRYTARFIDLVRSKTQKVIVLDTRLFSIHLKQNVF